LADGVENAENLDERALIAKQSKTEAERLIEEFRPFLQSVVAKYARRRDSSQRDELLDVVMTAFYESIRSYDAKKGHFFPLARRVVNNRAIDYVRQVYRQSRESSLLDDTDESRPRAQITIIESASLQQYSQQHQLEYLQDEIEQFRAELMSWGITMEMLTKQSPKQKKLRDMYKLAIVKICQDPDIIQTIQLKHYFPVQAISQITGLPPKRLERARTFILASIFIKIGDYEILSDYVDY